MPRAKPKHPESRDRERHVRSILARCRGATTQLVRFLYCGSDGVIRGKACHVEFLRSYLDSGVGLTVAMQFSEAGYAFLGGILAHVPALLALTAASVNSYRRLQPRFWSSAYTTWGPDNKESTLRIPSKRRGVEMESTNVEFKPCDSSCNPYLALGGLLAAGLDGLERKLDPGAPALADPDTLSEAERARRGIRRYPTSLADALDALERDEVLRSALGEALAKEYLIVKRSEVRGFAAQDIAFEIEHHFYKY